MEEKQIEILEKYIKSRRGSDERDDVIDNIFFNEIYWPDSYGNKKYLFKDFESIKRFFKKDVRSRCIDDEKNHCGTMMRNASICDSINDVIYNRIYEEIEKRK